MFRRTPSLKQQFGCSWQEVQYNNIVQHLSDMSTEEFVGAKQTLDLAIGKRFYYSKACNTGKLTVAIVVQAILMVVFLTVSFGSLDLLLPMYVYVLALSTLQLHRYTSRDFVLVKWSWCRVPLVPSVLMMIIGTPSILGYAIWTTDEIGYVGTIVFICLIVIAGMFMFTALVELILFQFYEELRENYQSMWDEIVEDYPHIVEVLPANYKANEYIRL